MSCCIRSQDALYLDLVGCTIHQSLWLNCVDDVVVWISLAMSLLVNTAIWDTFPDDKSRELEAGYSAPQHDRTSPRMTWNTDGNWPFSNWAVFECSGSLFWRHLKQNRSGNVIGGIRIHHNMWYFWIHTTIDSNYHNRKLHRQYCNIYINYIKNNNINIYVWIITIQ